MQSETRRSFFAASAVTAVSASRALGAGDRIRIGVIGTGARGRYLMRALTKIGGVEWVAVCDIYDVRRAQAAAHGRAVALVGFVMNNPDARVRGRQSVRDPGRRVAAAVVDGDDLELVGERGQHFERLGDERLDVLGFVVRGEEVGKRTNAGPIGGLGSDVGHGGDYRFGPRAEGRRPSTR